MKKYPANNIPATKGFSLVEIMLYVSVAITVSVLSVIYGAKLVAEQDARNAAAEMLILKDTVTQAYSFRTDFTGLTTASFLSTHQAPSFLALADNSGLVIPEIKASVTIAEELPSITGVQKPSFAIFVRDLSTSDCSVIAARLGSSFSNIVVNGSSVIDSSGFRPDLAASSCSSMPAGNVVKLVSERTDPWVVCRNLGTQFEEDICPVGFVGTITYSREYSCAANAGFEPGSLGARVETKRVCCISNAPQTEVRSDCPAGFTGTKTWAREYSCAGNSGNEPGAWNAWHITSNDCKADCSIPWGGSIVHGANVQAWQSSVVPFGSSCQDETRTCDNGTLSGSYSNQTCSVAPPGACSLPWGGSVAHGLSANAYSSATVPYGSSCQAESRPCYNGSLGGSYSFQNCAADPPPDACSNIAGVQAAPPVNGYASGGVCSCNSGYTLNGSTGMCSSVNYGGSCVNIGMSLMCISPSTGQACITFAGKTTNSCDFRVDTVCQTQFSHQSNVVIVATTPTGASVEVIGQFTLTGTWNLWYGYPMPPGFLESGRSYCP